ncbi:hypothetical protein NJL88_29115 [Streptomyces sp. DK15]|uniref:hypothetical protein n=1 Tax=Streptomyces sp. DK15 TaxID=2957499 RepID=UPI0029BCBED4|nr:hypothetical protein [Streptomyces sp. DK15]MDX2394051.1 hypothetical protein [Streptomyces sp. DK15]
MTARSEREPEKNKKPRTVSIPGRLEYPEDLTPGKTEKGGLHHNLYDNQGRLKKHADFFPDAENEAEPVTDSEYRSTSRTKERDEFTEAIREVILDLLARTIAHAAVAAKPRIERWWDDQALPAIKSRWNKTPRRNRSAKNREIDSQPSTAEASTMVEATVVDSSHEAISVLDENKVSMSSTEARMRLLLALMARAFSEEQVRVVSNALIEDDYFAELKRAVDELTPQQVANIIQTLEVNPLFLNNETLTELEKALGRNEKINEALRLTDSENQLRSSGEH